jgi:hypothetical protein
MSTRTHLTIPLTSDRITGRLVTEHHDAAYTNEKVPPESSESMQKNSNGQVRLSDVMAATNWPIVRTES